MTACSQRDAGAAHRRAAAFTKALVCSFSIAPRTNTAVTFGRIATFFCAIVNCVKLCMDVGRQPDTDQEMNCRLAISLSVALAGVVAAVSSAPAQVRGGGARMSPSAPRTGIPFRPGVRPVFNHRRPRGFFPGWGFPYIDYGYDYYPDYGYGPTAPQEPPPEEVRAQPAPPPDLSSRLWSVRWFPDGGRLLAVANSPEGQDLWLITILGEAAPRLLYRRGVDPAISPDGQLIAFANSGPGSDRTYG